jgi:DNA polymerase-3 subunit delta'
LSRSIARDTLPPSLIFSGATGSDARQAAIAVAQALNCLQRVSNSALTGPRSLISDPNVPNIDACGVCAACTRIARGVHPDVILLEPGETGSIKVEQVREATDKAAYRPFEGKRRVVIIDQADALVPAAQNALLKTLEEPTPSSVFVLVTARPDVLLPTVRSRCVRLWFAERAAETLDVEARDIAQQVLGHVASSTDPRGRLEAAKELLANTGAGGAIDRSQLSTTLRAMASLLRDVALLAARPGGKPPTAVTNRDVQPWLERLAPTYHGGRGVRAFAAVDQALAALDRNAGVKIVADWLVLEL